MTVKKKLKNKRVASKKADSPVNDQKADGFVARWRELEARGGGLDYERAVFASDLRAEFADGIEGDKQFKRWARGRLHTSVSRANGLLTLAAAKKLFSSQDEWNQLGHRSGVVFLTKLDRRGRTRVLRAAKQRMREQGTDHVGDGVLRELARELGVSTPMSRSRQRSNYALKQDLSVVLTLIDKVYSIYDNLVELTDEERDVIARRSALVGLRAD